MARTSKNAPSSTTIPSESTGLGLSRGGAIEVQWVFPERLATPLSGKSVVGRDDSCATVLSGGEASRRHAEFRIDGPIAAVRDLDSRNGVFVNGERVTDAPLAPGDVVRCGEWIGVLVATTEPSGSASFAEIGQGWYGGATLRAAVEPARRLAIDLPIVIQGETGTGKEGTARAIHAWSGRSGPFVAVNCAALPEELAEAELFGYRKGAFTGAAQASPGLFRAADGGSIFLDEILDLPPGLQPKLLRVLEDRHVRALGETRDAPVDVRVIAATQESLAAAVASRRFRADLHARLDGLTVVLPPLRARREDIAPLFIEFIRQHAGGRPPVIEAKLIEALCLYDWPLNVRELLLLARRLLGLHGHEPTLKRTHLPHRMLEPRADSPGTDASDDAPPVAGGKPARRTTDDRSEFDALIEALRREQGSVARAAALIGVSRARAYRLISAHPDFSLDKVRT